MLAPCSTGALLPGAAHPSAQASQSVAARPSCHCHVARPLLGRSAIRGSTLSFARQQTPKRHSALAARALQDVRESTFETDVLKADRTVLVDFWAPWCGPCRLIEPLLKEIEKETPELKIVKTDADSNPSLVEKYKVYGLPTLMLFKDGKKVDKSHREGAVTKPKLLEYLSKHGIAAAVAK